MPIEDIKKFCDFVGITVIDFFEILEKFRNKQIWTNNDGIWKINNYIIDDWNWKKIAHGY